MKIVKLIVRGTEFARPKVEYFCYMYTLAAHFTLLHFYAMTVIVSWGIKSDTLF